MRTREYTRDPVRRTSHALVETSQVITSGLKLGKSEKLGCKETIVVTAIPPPGGNEVRLILTSWD
jgi:hypothetical protein